MSGLLGTVVEAQDPGEPPLSLTVSPRADGLRDFGAFLAFPEASHRPAQTVRLATAGEIAEARRAGCRAAARPISQIASTPPTR